MYHFIPKCDDLSVILLYRLYLLFFVCSSEYNCLCLVTINYVIILISQYYYINYINCELQILCHSVSYTTP